LIFFFPGITNDGSPNPKQSPETERSPACITLDSPSPSPEGRKNGASTVMSSCSIGGNFPVSSATASVTSFSNTFSSSLASGYQDRSMAVSFQV